MTTARKILQLSSPFAMHQGGHLEQAQIAYETWGELDGDKSNAILVFTGLSPSAHAASSEDDPSPGWWDQMLGPDKPLDSDRYFIICVNSLGSCFGSTGPASVNPASGQPYLVDFPVLSIEDIANSAHQVVEALEIKKLYAVVGPSMGGMSALAYCMFYPDASDRLLSISSAARSQPFSTAIRSLQREMIRKDPAWNGGKYELGQGPIQGMRMARKLGMISYRSPEEWQRRFGRERVPEERKTGDAFCIDFEVEAYLESHANKFIGQFDPNCYLYLSRAMDLFDVADHGGSVESGLSRVGLKKVLIVGVETDILFPLEQQRELAAGLEAAGVATEFVSLASLQGHDSFLVDMDRLRPVLAKFFA
jgi:homoserine O-acetyltransferase